MIRLGLRLTLRGGREALARLAVTAGAVALGVGMLLIALAGMHAIDAQAFRGEWLNTGNVVSGMPGAPPASGHTSGDTPVPGEQPGGSSTPLWWRSGTDDFEGKEIDRVDVAALGPGSPVPPGIVSLPRPGQYDASPALAKLMASVPADELADRFPGHMVGAIGPSALPSPDSLVIVIGHTPSQMAALPAAAKVNYIVGTTGSASLQGEPHLHATTALQLVLAVGICALLFPVLVFIGTATRLSAARREQRFAAMRLVGASPRQVSVIAAVEASAAAVVGVVIGFLVFFMLRPVLTNVPFTGQPFAPRDLSLSGADVLIVAIGVPLAAAVAARVALRRVQMSPLGVARHVTRPAPRPTRLVLLAVGLAELGYFVVVGPPATSGGQALAFLVGFVLVMAGLFVAGPWLTMVGSRILVRRAGRPAGLLAGRRLTDDPRAAFRSIGGLILALYVTSAAVGMITTIVADHTTSGGGSAQADTLVDQLGAAPAPGRVTNQGRSVPAAVLADLQSIPGVLGVTEIHAQRADSRPGHGAPLKGLVSCAQLARSPALGRCATGSTVATVRPDFIGQTAVTTPASLASTVWPAASAPLSSLGTLPVAALAVATDGSPSAIERAKTALDNAFATPEPAATIGELHADAQRTISALEHMTEVVIIVSLVIAGCSLAVSVTGGMADRRRPFSLLRLSGVPMRVLRRVVVLEAALPLLLVSVVAVATGFLSAGLLVRSQLGESLRPPGFGFYGIVVGGLVVSLGIVAATLPLVERITGPEVARNE